MARRRLALALALLGALSIALRVPFLSVPLVTDEAGYAYVAHWLARGHALYRDLWFDRPQGVFAVYAVAMRLLGESTEAIRWGAALYNAATTALLYVLGARLRRPRAGLAAAGVFAVASASPVVEGFTANGELFMNLPVVGALVLAAGRRALLAGLTLALAAAIKPTALPTAGPALLVLLLWEPGARAARAARFGLGAALGLAPFAVHGIATDPRAYWYAVVGFRVEAHSAFSVGSSVTQEFAHTAPSVAVALLPVWVLAAGGAAALGWRSRAGAGALAWLGGAAVGAAAGGYWYWHYCVGVLPAAALLAGVGLDRLLARPGAPARAARAALAASAVLAVAFNARLVGASPEATSWNIYRRPAYLASKEIAAYVRARTSEHDAIYAAFAQADLYHLSGRRSAGAHLYWTEINRVPGAFEALLATLDDPARRPAYVIEIDRELEIPGRADVFWERVARYYQREATIGGFVVYRTRGGPAA